MSPFEMMVAPIGMVAAFAVATVVVVVFLGCITVMIRTYIKTRNSRANTTKFEERYCSKDDLKPYLYKIDKLEGRVRVLERIVTDKSRALAEEINELK